MGDHARNSAPMKNKSGRLISKGRWTHTFGALDLGTNNCRLLIAKPARKGFRVLEAFSKPVRLGEGIAESGRLTDQAQDRAVEALTVCMEKMERRGVTRVRAVATEACRRAANSSDFVERVREELGLSLDIIGPDEEAHLALGGCEPLIRRSLPRAIVFDIGGGSTQAIWLAVGHERARVLASLSIPVGVVSLTERIGKDPVGDERFDGFVEELAEPFRAFSAEHHIDVAVAANRVQMVGTSGTVTTLGGMDLGLERYIRHEVDGTFLDFDTIATLTNNLRRAPIEERAEHPCIGQDRADLVVAGCTILSAICRTWPVGKLRVADRGVREGILVRLMEEADQEAVHMREYGDD